MKILLSFALLCSLVGCASQKHIVVKQHPLVTITRDSHCYTQDELISTLGDRDNWEVVEHHLESKTHAVRVLNPKIQTTPFKSVRLDAEVINGSISVTKLTVTRKDGGVEVYDLRFETQTVINAEGQKEVIKFSLRCYDKTTTN